MKQKNIFCPIITSKDIGGGIKSTISLLNGLADINYKVAVLVPNDCEFLNKFSSSIEIYYFNQSSLFSLFKPLHFYKLCKFTKKVFDGYNKYNNTVYFCSDRPALMLAFLFSKKSMLFYISRGWFYTNISALFLRFFMFPRVKQFVGISEKQFNLMKQYAPKKSKINIIQNGIELPKHTFIPFIDNKVRLTTVGGICDRKNQMQCLELVVLLKDKINVSLNIFGTTFTPIDEGYKKTLENFIEENKIGHLVCFKGNENDFDVIYSQSDIVLSTAKEEGFGRTIIEAMSYGIPVIANSKAGGPKTIITNSQDGLLYDGSLTDLEQKVLFYINNEESRMQIIENAINLVKKKYTMKSEVEEYDKLIDSL